MFGLLVLVGLGALFVFVLPPLIPPSYQSAFTTTLARIAGFICILFAFASTSFVFVPDGHLGHLFRVYGGGPLTHGRIFAANREKGPQAQAFYPRVSCPRPAQRNLHGRHEPTRGADPTREGRRSHRSRRRAVTIRAGVRGSVPAEIRVSNARRHNVSRQRRPARSAIDPAHPRHMAHQSLSLG